MQCIKRTMLQIWCNHRKEMISCTRNEVKPHREKKYISITLRILLDLSNFLLYPNLILFLAIPHHWQFPIYAILFQLLGYTMPYGMTHAIPLHMDIPLTVVFSPSASLMDSYVSFKTHFMPFLTILCNFSIFFLCAFRLGLYCICIWFPGILHSAFNRFLKDK